MIHVRAFMNISAFVVHFEHTNRDVGINANADHENILGGLLASDDRTKIFSDLSMSTSRTAVSRAPWLTARAPAWAPI